MQPTKEQIQAYYKATKMFITNIHGKPTKTFDELQAQFEFMAKPLCF